MRGQLYFEMQPPLEVGYKRGLGKRLSMRSIEICAGAGGQALGLEQAGFEHVALIEIDPAACATLRKNRPHWNIIEDDVKAFSAKEYEGIVDLVAGGVPCPPFSVAGKQLGHDDERDLFPEAMRIIRECNPKAIMLENVRGLFDSKFDGYRSKIRIELETLGYVCIWELVQANHFSVPQQRPRTILIALKEQYISHFIWPIGLIAPPPTVGQILLEEMASNGWEGAAEWASRADGIAPTLVGGSKKHGGADLGPTRARSAWRKLGVNGSSVADMPPEKDFVGDPKLTVKMAALIQGFPPEWEITGKKTPAYRQVGNAFPPPVAKALGGAILQALSTGNEEQEAILYERARSAV
jgi:DNA (cytosine-5)-methyltransferase 1